MTDAQEIELSIRPRWVAPVVPSGAVLEHHHVLVDHGRILDVLPAEEAQRRFRPRTVAERPEHLLIPGFVNAHTHAAMSLLRGCADDLPLMRWLEEHIWPVEGALVGPDMVGDGVELAVAEMVAGGTTCFNDMYFFPDVVARTAARLGVRASVSMIVLDFPTAWAADADEYLRKGLALRDELGDHPLVRTAFGPHAPYTVSDGPLGRVRALSDELDVPVQMHVHETADEVTRAEAETGRRPLARLDDLGLLSPLLQAVHMTQLTDAEIDRLAETGVSVVHCPESNLKLASGLCRVADLDRAGVNLALGTDGAASNNDLDMLGEMRTAALLAKGVSGDASALSAARALEMATLGGARAMGIADETGSIEAGKWADLVCVDLSDLSTQPCYDPVAQLVYAASRDQVTDTWVAGRALYADGRLTRIDPRELSDRIQVWRSKVLEVGA